TQPRSTATRMAMIPKPEPPMATLSSVALARRVHRSGARPLTGCAPSQKKLNVWRCTTSSRESSGSVASAAASIVSPIRRGMRRTPSRFQARDFALFPRPYVFWGRTFDEPDRETDGADDPGGEAGAAHHDSGGSRRHGARDRR